MDFLIRMYFGAPAVCIGYLLLPVNMTLCLSSLASLECLARLCIRVFIPTLVIVLDFNICSNTII